MRWRLCETIHYHLSCYWWAEHYPLRARRHQIFLKSGFAYRVCTSQMNSQMFLIPSISLSDFALQMLFAYTNLGRSLTFQTINVAQRHFLGNYSGRQHFFYLICYEMTSTVKPKVNHWLSLMTLKETGHVRKQLHFHFCCHRSFIAFDSNSTPCKELLTTSYFKF